MEPARNTGETITMDTPTLFDPIPWNAVGITVLQTFILFWIVIIGLKLVGRRVFGELGPQDVALLLLVAESCNLGLTPQKAGFWGSLFSIMTLLVIVATVERVKPFRQLMEEKPIVLLQNGHALEKVMQDNLVEKADLEAKARQYGVPDCSAFETMMLESDGSISGVLKPEYRKPSTLTSHAEL